MAAGSLRSSKLQGRAMDRLRDNDDYRQASQSYREEAARLTAFLNRFPNCPVCGGKHWQVTKANGEPVLARLITGPMMGSAVTGYAVTCNTCGTIRLIAQGSIP
jgi:hypothetical protein